jgi:hypothetical protein
MKAKNAFRSVYNKETKVYKHINEVYKVKIRRHCGLRRLPRYCPIYKFTAGGCDSCG